MKSSIYISPKKIEVIGYEKLGKNISIKEYKTYPLPEGTMINGKITDHANLVECLTIMLNEKPNLFKNSVLTVDGSSIFSKRIVVPKLSKRQYRQIVRDEFAETAENLEELVCDYHLLKRDKNAPASILACAAQKGLVQSYIAAFKEAGIKLKAIRVGVQTLLNYVSVNQKLNEKTFVLNVIDGVTMLSMIFEKGHNVFISRTRLYSEDNTLYIQEIMSNLSGLIQFNKSEHFSDITRCYYLGLNEEDMDMMKKINIHDEIALDLLDIFGEAKGAGKLDPDTHFAFLNAMNGDNSIDFIRSIKTLKALNKNRKSIGLWIPVFAGLTVALSVPIVYLLVQTNKVDKSLNELNEYITSDYVVSKSAEIDQLAEETAGFTNAINQLYAKESAENSSAEISNEILDIITGTLSNRVSITYIEFNETTNLIRVSGISANETYSAEYVNMLKQSSLIKAVQYTGYSFNNEGNYSFSINVELAAEEAAE